MPYFMVLFDLFWPKIWLLPKYLQSFQHKITFVGTYMLENKGIIQAVWFHRVLKDCPRADGGLEKGGTC